MEPGGVHPGSSPCYHWACCKAPAANSQRGRYSGWEGHARASHVLTRKHVGNKVLDSNKILHRLPYKKLKKQYFICMNFKSQYMIFIISLNNEKDEPPDEDKSCDRGPGGPSPLPTLAFRSLLCLAAQAWKILVLTDCLQLLHSLPRAFSNSLQFKSSSIKGVA